MRLALDQHDAAIVIKVRAFGFRNDMVALGLQNDIICWMIEGVFRWCSPGPTAVGVGDATEVQGRDYLTSRALTAYPSYLTSRALTAYPSYEEESSNLRGVKGGDGGHLLWVRCWPVATWRSPSFEIESSIREASKSVNRAVAEKEVLGDGIQSIYNVVAAEKLSTREMEIRKKDI
jgi:hypothetical protein